MYITQCCAKTKLEYCKVLGADLELVLKPIYACVRK